MTGLWEESGTISTSSEKNTIGNGTTAGANRHTLLQKQRRSGTVVAVKSIVWEPDDSGGMWRADYEGDKILFIMGGS